MAEPGAVSPGASAMLCFSYRTHSRYMPRRCRPSASSLKQAVAGGYAPGTPDWVTLHKQHVQEIADPVVTTPAGMMLRSQALAQMGGTPAPAGVTFTPLPEGGPTPSASGNFLNIKRYYGGQ
jgi:hypothetical protein